MSKPSSTPSTSSSSSPSVNTIGAGTRLKPRKRKDYKFFLSYRTRWSDNDQYAHVNNAIYYFLFDSIINTYLINHCGLAPTGPESPTIALSVSSNCIYFRPLSFPTVIDLGLRVNRLGRSSVQYEIGVFEQGKDGVAAVGGFVHVFVGRKDRKPVKAIEEGFRKGLGKLIVVEGGSKL